MYPDVRIKATKYPIDEYENHILYLLEKKQVLVVVGETGSGKSTRIPQILFSAGIYNEAKTISGEAEPKNCQICITQPRRVAAIQLARRVSYDLRTNLGNTVGYAIRFQDVCHPEHTMIKFITEGILIREMISNPLLERYSVIIVDEVHERNLSTDLILGFLKCILVRRKDLKLIICSATLDVKQILGFFKESTLLLAKGKSYPIKIFHKKQPVANYLEASVDTVKNIHETSRLASGKILVFLTGLDEIEYVCHQLNDYSRTLYNRMDVQQLVILPFHALLAPNDLSKVFEEHGKMTRVCIVSTNIAETSLTINDIAYVIDCGFEKTKTYDNDAAIGYLVRSSISKSSARQRAGRSGRTRAGTVYRLYSDFEYMSMRENTTPEIERCSLLETIILLKSLGVQNITKFPLITKMPKNNLASGLELLYALQAIDEQGNLTKTGNMMAQFNIDPKISKILVSPVTAGCTQEICRLAAILQIKDIYSKTGRFASSLWLNPNLVNLCTKEGDMISYLNIFNAFSINQKNQKWAERRNLNYKNLLNALDIAEKLERQVKKCGLNITSSKGRTELIQRSIVSGLFPNAAYLHPNGIYKTIRGDREVHIHPTSVLSEMIDRPKLVVFVDILNTSKPYMQHIMAVEQKWLLDAAPHYYAFATNLEMMRSSIY